jgi:hypothetical protein
MVDGKFFGVLASFGIVFYAVACDEMLKQLEPTILDLLLLLHNTVTSAADMLPICY